MSCGSELNIRLANGALMPAIGYGTWRGQGKSDDLTAAILHALRRGYRLVDTAVLYETEAQVGAALRQSGLDRSSVWIQTKIWPDSYDRLKETFDEALKRLQVEYVDSLMLHWPVFSPRWEGYATMEATWTAMEELHSSGKVKNLAVSNFQPWDLDQLHGLANVGPLINQVEVHPWWPQEELLQACREKGVVVQAFRPFGNLAKRETLPQGTALMVEDPVLTELAASRGATVQQIIVSWLTQRGIGVVAKSGTFERIESNLRVFKLSPEEMLKIQNISRRQMMCSSPFKFDALARPAV